MSGSTSVIDIYAVATTKEVSIYRGIEKISSWTKFTYTPTCIALLRDNEIAVGCDDSKTRIYSISNGTFTETGSIETRTPPTALAYSPNEDYLAIGDAGRQVDIYQRSTNWTPKIKGNYCFHTSKVSCLSWSPSGNHLASGSLDENIFIWNLSDVHKRIQFQFCHTGGVNSVSWLGPKSLISVGNDLCTVTWKIPLE
jgi:WD40 repeat protein